MMISRVRSIAERQHDGQLRKYTGDPYIVHPINVGQIIVDITPFEQIRYGWYCEVMAPIVAALLHDVVEDTDIDLEELADELEPLCGPVLHALVMAAVEALTELPKQPGQNRAARKALYADQIAEAGWIAQLVKVADLIDNTSTIAELDPDFWRVYRVEKRAMLEKIAASPSWLGKPAWVSDELMQRAWQQTEEST